MSDIQTALAKVRNELLLEKLINKRDDPAFALLEALLELHEWTNQIFSDCQDSQLQAAVERALAVFVAPNSDADAAKAETNFGPV